MKKRILIPLLISTLSLSGCCLFSHDFAEATCTTPSTCTKCGEIQGEALGHTFTDATCTEAKTCSVCNFAEGNPLEHQWLEATTENPKTCDRCGLTEGEPLQDDFSQAKIDDHEVEIEAPVKEESGPVDSTGDNVTIDEGDYVEPSPEEKAAQVEKDTSEMGQPSETFLKYSEKYKNGEISEEMYNKAVELEKRAQERDANGTIEQKIQEALSQPEVIMPEGALQGTPDTGDSGEEFNFDGPRNQNLAGDFIQ